MLAARLARGIGRRPGVAHILGHLYKEQLDALNDKRDVRVVYGTRRSGKTELLAAMCVLFAIPGETGVFVSLNARKSYAMLYSKLSEFKRLYGIDFKADGSKLIFTLENGGKVQCRGLASMPDIDLLRGDRPPFAIIDEAGHTHEERTVYAIEEALQPSLADFWGRGGSGLILAGTPNEEELGWWARVCGGKEFPEAGIHKLDLRLNPMFANGRAERYLENVLKQNGWTWETPKFRREYLGEFVADLNTLCLPGWTEGVLPQHMAPKDGLGILGVDFGLRDACAFVVLRCIDNHLHAVHSEAHSGMTIPDIAALIFKLFSEYNISYSSGDAYGMGAGYIKTLAQSYSVPIQEAKYPEAEKAARIDTANGIATAGNLHIYEGATTLAQQCRTLIWDKERKHPRDGYPDHEFDALLIAMGRHRQDFMVVERTDEEQRLIDREERALKQIRAANRSSWRNR